MLSSLYASLVPDGSWVDCPFYGVFILPEYIRFYRLRPAVSACVYEYPGLNEGLS